MAQVLTLAMYMRAVRLPVEYIPLAKGDSRSYLLLESAYDVVLVVLVIIGFRQWGILGAGVGIALTGFLHFVLVYVYAHHHYAYRMSTVVLFYAFLQLTLGILVFFCVRSDVQWVGGVLQVYCVAPVLWSLACHKVEDWFVEYPG